MSGNEMQNNLYQGRGNREMYIYVSGKNYPIYGEKMTHDKNNVYVLNPYTYIYTGERLRIKSGIMEILKSDIYEGVEWKFFINERKKKNEKIN